MPDPASPSNDTSLSPAERVLKEEGGDLLPKEFGGPGAPPSEANLEVSGAGGLQLPPDESRKADVVTPQSPPKSTVIKLPDGAVSTGQAPAPGSEKAEPRSPEQIARDQRLLEAINLELGIFDSVLNSVKRMIRDQVSRDPLDSAEIGQGLFGPGVRTPLEQSEPYIAIEVYRQVRRNIREEDGRGEKEPDETDETSPRPPVAPAPPKQPQPGE